MGAHQQSHNMINVGQHQHLQSTGEFMRPQSNLAPSRGNIQKVIQTQASPYRSQSSHEVMKRQNVGKR